MNSPNQLHKKFITILIHEILSTFTMAGQNKRNLFSLL